MVCLEGWGVEPHRRSRGSSAPTPLFCCSRSGPDGSNSGELSTIPATACTQPSCVLPREGKHALSPESSPARCWKLWLVRWTGAEDPQVNASSRASLRRSNRMIVPAGKIRERRSNGHANTRTPLHQPRPRCYPLHEASEQAVFMPFP